MGMLNTLFRRSRRRGQHVGRRVDLQSSVRGASSSQTFQYRAGFERLEGKAMLAVTTLFTDDFATSAGSTFDTDGAIGTSGTWSLARSGADWGAKIDAGRLELTNDASATSNVNGWVFGYRDVEGMSGWNTTLAGNSGLVSWDFNMRQIRTDPAGFGVGTNFISYGAAFVLAGTSATAASTGSGYAVVLGQSGSTDPLRLVSFNNGLQGTLANILTSNTAGLTDFGAEHVSVRVTYLPITNTWELFVRNDGAAFVDPATGTLTSQGKAGDTAFTSTPGMRYLGGYWQGSTAGSQTAFFDNVSLKLDTTQSATPLIGTVGSLVPFTAPAGTASAAQSFAVTGVNLTANISATVPAGFEVSSDGTTFGPTAMLAQTAGSASGTISVRIAASNTTPGPLSGNVVLSSDGAASANVSVSGTVRPALISLPYSENFEASQGDWFALSKAGTRNWAYVTSTLGNGTTTGGASTKLWEMYGFGSDFPANDWLMLGPVDLSAAASPTITLNSLFRYTTTPPELSLKVSTDYDGVGDPTLATWTEVAFPQALTELTRTSSGQVPLPQTVANQSGVYVAFHYVANGTSFGTTALWQIDDVVIENVEVLSLNLAVPTAMNEGTGGDLFNGSVSIPVAQAGPITVTVTSTDTTEILLDNGDLPFRTSISLVIPAGQTSAQFYVQAQRDRLFDGNQNVRLTASIAAGSVGFGEFLDAEAFIQVTNTDVAPTPLTELGYFQDFATFVVDAALPAGWGMTSSGTATNWVTRSNWGTTTTGVKHSVTTDGVTNNVLGFQHTSNTGTVVKSVTLENATTETITEITVSYLGRLAVPANGRDPVYTVAIESATGLQTLAVLRYSTADGDSIRRQAAITGLAIVPGGTFTITWASDGPTAPQNGANGNRRQIGIGDVSVTLGASTAVPTVSGLTVDPALITRTSAEVAATVPSAGGITLTNSGFVYVATAGLTGELTRETVGAIDVPQLSPFEGDFVASLEGLDPGISYTIRAYASNSLGTSYTAVQTFRSLNVAASLTGVYEQPFDNYAGTLPVGWSALGSGNQMAYGGTWNSEQAAGFRGGARDPGVLGYQHTSTSGILTVTLSLVNDTGYTVNSLDIDYLGRVASVSQALSPQWLVNVNGTLVTELGYSTANDLVTGLPADRAVSATVSGLSIAPGAEIIIQWESTRGGDSGTARQIGIGEVVVTAGVEATALPTVGLGDPSTSLVTSSGARLQGSVTATNGSLTAHGFVYALSSENADPTLGGANVAFVEVTGGGLQAFDFAANVTGLVAGAGYSFKAYATNSLGTSYSAVGTWTTALTVAAPTVSAPTSTALTATTATLGGTVVSDGGAAVTSHGVVIAVQSVNPTPAVGDLDVIVVSLEQAISGAFTLPVTGLADNTAYAFRAYATNSAGTSYSDAGSFSTLPLPTTLAVGDLSIIGFNSNTPDGFAFVTWVDLTPNTQIKFTDNGFLSAGAAGGTGNARGTENFVTWTNTSVGTIAAGTVITIVDAQSSPVGATASVGSTAQVLGGLATAGDQIFAYQGVGAGTSANTSDFGNNANPTTFTGSLVFGLTFGADWLAEGEASTNVSYLPAELSASTANIALLAGTTTRGQYTGARSGFASLADAKAAVTNRANWTTATSTGVITLDATAFFLGDVVGTTTNLGSIAPLTVDVGQSVTFSGTVAAASGTAAPTGTVQIRNGGPTGALLASTSVTAGSAGSGSFSVTTAEIPVGTYADVQAFFLATGGFGSSTSAAVAETLTILSTAVATSITLDEITPLSSTVGTTITFNGTVAAGVGTTTPAGTIQIRSGGSTGTLVASTSTITGTGGSGSYSIAVSNLSVGVYGTLQAFFVANPLFDASQSDYFLNAVTVRPTGVMPQFVRWTFEGDSLVPVVGSGTASAIGGVTSSFAAGTGSGSALSTAAFPAQGAASGTAGARFMVSTVGRESISLSFDQRASGTASRWAQVDYTLDGGSTWVVGHWTNGGVLPAETFTTFTVDFSGVIGANNNPDFGVRIVSIFQPTTTAYQPAGTGSYGISGTWRFDNVTFGGFAGATISTATGADYLRFVTYNIAASQDTGVPRSGLDTVLAAIGTEVVAGWSGPIDLLALQEVQSQTVTTQLVVDSLNGIYGSGTYARGSVNAFSFGGGTMGVVFNTGSLSLLEEVSIATGGPRNAMRYLFRPLAATVSETFYVYVSHFKSGTDSQSVSTRAFEAAALRADADRLGAGASVLYVGDFNVYESSEVGYQALVGSGGTGQAFDPVNRPGNWSNSSSFRDVFTQSPAVTAAGGLIGGGLDDRFDFQLVSDAVLTGNGLRYQTGSYRAFGNNGTVSLNNAINNQSNTALPDLANRTTVLDLLATVSDHLPVVADYTVPAGAPLSALSTTVGTPSSAVSFNVRGSNLTGNLSVAAPVGFEISTSSGSGYTSNPLSLTAAAGVVNATVFIRLASGTVAGSYGGDISISGGSAAASTLAMPTSTITDPAPATITVTSIEAFGGAGLDWALFDATGTAGTGWDVMSGSGTFTLVNATAENPFVVYPITLSSISPVTRGGATNFDATQNYSWRLGTFAGGIVGFTPGVITVDTADFANAFDANRGSFTVSQSGTSLFVNYTYSAAVPTISTSGTLSGVSTTYGTASGTTQITVSGSDLAEVIIATAPTGFEVSRDGAAFAPTATFTPTSGSVSGTLFARLAATTNAGTYAGNIAFSSLGATGVSAALPSSTVSPKALTVRADNKTRVVNTANPVLSAAIMGFVNGDTAAATLTGLPALSTTAVLGSVAGSYPITVGVGTLAANNGNYTFTTLVDGTLSVTNTPVKVAGLYVRGSGWNTNYLNLSPFTTVGSDKLGWQLRDGGSQLATSGGSAAQVTWNNVNVISVRFDQPITTPQAAALKLILGTGNQTITPSSVSLAGGGTIAQFVLPSSLVSGKYVLSIAATGITDAAGTTVLDGEWTTSTSTFTAGSGDGTAGGMFNFAFNALVGDVNANGTRNSSDVSALRPLIASTFGAAPSATNFRYDLNGNNLINNSDATALRNLIASTFGTNMNSLTAATAPSPSLATIGSPTFTNVTATSVRLGATVTSTGGEPVLERGVVALAGTTGTPDVTDPAAITLLSAGGQGAFTVDVTGLTPSTAYRFRAFVRTSLGIVYTEIGSFTTGAAV